MPYHQIATALSVARTPAALDVLAKATWAAYGAGRISDEEAATLSEAIAGQRPRRHAPTPPRGHRVTFFAQARLQRSPDRQRSIERRRRLAASGPMPPQLAAHFTTGELAVLYILADEVRRHGRCDRSYDELAARAGVCRSLAKKAIILAGRLGLLQIQHRPQRGRKSQTNIVRIVSREWLAWISRRPVGVKTETATDSKILRGYQCQENGTVTPGRERPPATKSNKIRSK